jgi:hypothetical protein
MLFNNFKNPLPFYKQISKNQIYIKMINYKMKLINLIRLKTIHKLNKLKAKINLRIVKALHKI